MPKKPKTPEKTEDTLLVNAVRTSAHQIWQAGLGAFAKAQEEGGRVFSKLVQEGTELQKRSRMMAEGKIAEAGDTVSSVADSVGKQASGSWDKLEQVFEDRVARALATIGVPTHKDIQALTLRVEQLSELVAELGGKKAPARPATRKSAVKPATRKSAVKPALKAGAQALAKAAPTKAPAKKTAAARPGAAKGK
ncbi:MAG: phasin family protein [Telluria sp.]|nr:phasin family protein [Telluria sp.]